MAGHLSTADCRLSIGDWGLAIGDCRFRNSNTAPGVRKINLSGATPAEWAGMFGVALGPGLASAGRMNAKALALQARTQRFYQRVIRLTASLPTTGAAQRITPQLLDSAGSADSNYRSACRGRTNREFIAKIGLAAEEADESKGWLEALVGAGIGDAEALKELIKEADELVAIFTASEKTARRNAARKKEVEKRLKPRPNP